MKTLLKEEKDEEVREKKNIDLDGETSGEAGSLYVQPATKINRPIFCGSKMDGGCWR